MTKRKQPWRAWPRETMTTRRLALGAACLLSCAFLLGASACRKKPPPLPANAPKVAWSDVLDGVWDIRTSATLIGATWLAPMGDEPAPGEVVLFASDTFAPVATDRGWMLFVGDSLSSALVVDETDKPLSYVVRHIGATSGLPLPTPDGRAWPLRGTACSGTGVCAIVRWSPIVDSSARGGEDRLLITAVDARGAHIMSETTLSAADLHAGTAEMGGIVANPVRPVAYLVERTPDLVAVREIDLAAGKLGWRATAVPASTDMERETVELFATADGSALVLVQGVSRSGYFRPSTYTTIDAASGQAQELAVARPKGDPALMAPAADGAALVLLDIGLSSDETPDAHVLGIASLDARSGELRPLASREQIPPPGTGVGPGTIVVSANRLTLGFKNLRSPLPTDPSPPAIQEARRQLVAPLLSPRR